MGGEPVLLTAPCSAMWGLSPRGRGTLSLPPVAEASESSSADPVYPRVGGEPTRIGADTLPDKGLSPRGRGTRSCGLAWSLVWGSIPAWAGNPLVGLVGAGQLTVYPRVGGEPPDAQNHPVHQGLSPLGGDPNLWGSRTAAGGVYPRWAGNPSSPTMSSHPPSVYPRVGGEPHIQSSSRLLARVYPRVGGEPRY